ncbi:hypothetical protein Tco_1029349 [Tanacetum coccineum]|uniref:Zinc finger, CCHC-type n=1 Tax=Tanacetum coccineum TaxID=301880 RepID=A0ABQ5G362_9ASTR
MEITVVTLVKEQMSLWKGNLPRAPKWTPLGHGFGFGKPNKVFDVVLMHGMIKTKFVHDLRGRKTWWPSFTSWRPRILGVGRKLNGVEAKVDDYDELGDSMTRWKDVAWFRLSREGDEDGKDLESKIDDVMATRSLQGGDGAACNIWVLYLSFRGKYGLNVMHASKKKTCITGSTMKFEFVALVDAGKEAEWLRNLIHEIPIWPKPIASISIHCDSATTLAKAYSQMYNGKSRYLGVRHSMIRELIMNDVISIEFVRS